MSFGLEVFDASSRKILSTSDFTYRIIYSELITFSTANQVITRTVPGFNPSTCGAFVYHERPDLYADTGPYVWSLLPWMSVSGETITIRERHPDGGINSGARGVSGSSTLFRLICARFL